MVKTIAYMHPFYGGDAVYMARALLHLDVIDQVPALRRAQQQQQQAAQQAKTVKGKLQPNPASNSVTFTYPVNDDETINLYIYDVYGKETSAYKINKAVTSITLLNYVQGMYFIHVYVNGTETETHKLVVIK